MKVKILSILMLIGGFTPLDASISLAPEDRDTTQTEMTDSAALQDDSIASDSIQNLQKEASETNGNFIPEIQDRIETEHKSDKAGVVLGIIAIALAVLAFGFAFKKFKAISIKLKDLTKPGNKEDYAFKEAMEKLEKQSKKISDLENELADLRTELKEIRKRKPQKESNIDLETKTGSETPALEVPNQTEKVKHPQEKVDKNYYNGYVDTLSVNDNGELIIPVRTLSDVDSDMLFKVKLNMATGEGEYSLNPAADMEGKWSDLNNCTDGVSSSKTSGYKTVAPGILKREGAELKVLRKLEVG